MVLVVMFGCVYQTQAIPITAGLVGYWSGDGNANDQSGNNNHGTLQNGAMFDTGIVGQAFSFDGVNDVVNTPVLLTSQGSLVLWLNSTSLDTLNGIFGTFSKANGNDRLASSVAGLSGGPGVGPNRLAVNLGSAGINDIDISNPLITGSWIHLAVTFDYISDSYTLYVNGQAVTSSTALRNTPTGALSFGGWGSDFGQLFVFNGLIDEVAVYDRVLSASEIQEIAFVSNVIPEPSTYLLFAVGFLGIIGISHRQRKKSA
jgi:hypothetical protein